MSAALDELIETNARYVATEPALDPSKRQQRIGALAAEDQMTDGEIVLKRFFYSPVGIQSLDHLLSCWRPGKGRGWTDKRVLTTLEKLLAATLIQEVEGALEMEYELTELAYRHYSEHGRKTT
ncbi:hypothetical protein [Vreelandella nanhaiensis]|uniref:Uncharacterized protein n=1 Tax=Vreelandella nanhaiensis TaxID=1258546 RepID=A0A433KXW4_9GAMM|nr:hypothetical protein [Halomonas nanhaiensis]RUR34508.1 hypothetical protein ELY38_02650 [Halomonas nanhaiensis]